MTALVIAEHDNAALKPARPLNTVTAAAQCGGDVHVLVAGHNAGGAAQAAARRSPASPRCCMPMAPAFAHGLAENVAAQVLALAGRTTATSCSRPPRTARTSRRAWPRCSTWRRSRDITKVDRADTFERPIYAGNAIATVQSARRDQGDHRAHHRLRRRRRRAAAAPRSRRVAAVADSGKSSFVGSEIAKSDRPELTAAKIIVSGGRALGSGDKFNEVLDAAGRQARRRARRQPRRGRRGLRAQRLAGRPDRQDRRAAAVHRRRHLAARSSTWPA